MNSPRASRRQVLRALSLGVASYAVTGCDQASDQSRQAPPVRTQDLHVSLTTPRRYARLVLADTDTPEVLSPLARAAVQHQASIGLSAALLSDLARALPTMPVFPGDILESNRTHAHVALLVEGDTAHGVQQRAGDLLTDVGRGLTPTWEVDLHHDLAGRSHGRALTKNVFGFTEGFGSAPTNPAATTLLDRTSPAPAWARGGSLLAIRVIRISHQLWNKDTPQQHEQIIGRRKDGHWLNGDPATSTPPFESDKNGAITPFDSHVRRANPRTKTNPHLQITRRSWNYHLDDTDESGTLFMAHTNDLNRFETLQRRVIGDALSPYTLTTGGGYYYVPPPNTGWLRRRAS